MRSLRIALVLAAIAAILVPIFPVKAATEGWQWVYDNPSFGRRELKLVNGTCEDSERLSSCIPATIYHHISGTQTDWRNTYAGREAVVHVDPANPTRGTVTAKHGLMSEDVGDTITIQKPEMYRRVFSTPPPQPPPPPPGQPPAPNPNESAATKKIRAGLSFHIENGTVGDERTVGPVDVLLKSADGTQTLQTVKSNQSSDAESGSNNVDLEAMIENVNPGAYLVCVPSIDDSSADANGCKPVTKVSGAVATVNFQGNAKQEAFVSTASAEDQGEEECAIEAGAFAWIFCPIVRIARATFEPMMDRVVGRDGETSLLKIDVLSKSQSAEGMRQIWNAMRTLANVAFVLIFLAIIFANTLSLNMDSYTIKRMLPRLVAATILVQFSFLICGLVIDFANVLGDGLAGLLEEALRNAAPEAFTIGNNPRGFEQLGAAVILTVVGGAFIAVVGLPFIILLIISVLISVLGVFVTLLLRQLIIAVLIVLAPLAFAAWVLPNTENMFRFWWKNFFKTVMMYPLIVLIISVGNILAAIANLGESNTPTQFAAAFFPVIAFFMIPATFKMVGGVTSMVAGKVMGATGEAADKTSGYAKRRYTPQMKNKMQTLAAGGGVKFAGMTLLGGQGSNKMSRGLGRTLGMAGTLSGPRRAQANFNAAERAAGKELEELGFDDLETRKLILGGKKALDSMKADTKSDAEKDRLDSVWNNVRRYHGSTAHMASAARGLGKDGAATDDTREAIRDQFGDKGPLGNIGAQLWKEAAQGSRKNRAHLQYTDYSGKFDSEGFAKHVATRDVPTLAQQRSDSWEAILGAPARGGRPARPAKLRPDQMPSRDVLETLIDPASNYSVDSRSRQVIEEFLAANPNHP